MFGMVAFLSTFLSTPSARRATPDSEDEACGILISIHALREEGDRSTTTTTSMSLKFLSTPSARRATLYYRLVQFQYQISIHALREEGDL